MVQAASQPLTFEQFLERYPEDGGRYELRHGVILEMRPIGAHEEVISLVRRKLDFEIERLGLPYFIPQSCLVKPLREGEGYLPDIIVLDQAKVKTDPYWKRHSSISTEDSVRLVVEVVSTNWQDDYLTKLAEYEKLGIPEYWIVDYRALGGVRFIGSPKVPTVWMYRRLGEEYEAGQAFRPGQTLTSPTFSELALTVDQIVEVGQAADLA
ncbi:MULTISPECIES: Uma2 family endonuclease [Cyanophyceae]|uniref:Uma2 family endonuclease n=1 Tax=Leptolyngbya subtilissima DQ-A4 TaxID=2933933 RepID=A0ABV0JZ25_9CYAN|nr:Uma2 family endonuclease [Nodosilinea sp. FACHB-141]MBD2112409.1 Uma2 family endonuclease [Nodosilinea sp. FACHB-141]